MGAAAKNIAENAKKKEAEKSDAEASSTGLMTFSDKGLCPDMTVTQVRSPTPTLRRAPPAACDTRGRSRLFSEYYCLVQECRSSFALAPAGLPCFARADTRSPRSGTAASSCSSASASSSSCWCAQPASRRPLSAPASRSPTVHPRLPRLGPRRKRALTPPCSLSLNRFQAIMAVSMLKTTAFAFYFIVSTCCWMGSSCFIVGPQKQFENMKQPKRRNCASASPPASRHPPRASHHQKHLQPSPGHVS